MTETLLLDHGLPAFGKLSSNAILKKITLFRTQPTRTGRSKKSYEQSDDEVI